MAKKSAVCSYTTEGRELIHTNLSLNPQVMTDLLNQPSLGRSTEFSDCKLSLYSAQRGKCALCGEYFENADDIVSWLKIPKELGGKERYQNMVMFHKRFLPFMQEYPKKDLKMMAHAFILTKELMLKINNLRTQAGLSTI